jgi:hypothetical protein
VAKPNYSFEKRQRELQKKQKKADKAQRKAHQAAAGSEPDVQPVDTPAEDRLPPAPV